MERHRVLLNGLALLAFWILAPLKGPTAYPIAGFWTITFIADLLWRRARSRGMPGWTANEAYITRWLRWRRTR